MCGEENLKSEVLFGVVAVPKKPGVEDLRFLQ